LHKHDGESAVHKPGPIETGRIDYKAADYGMHTGGNDDDQYLLAYPKHKLHETDNVKTPRKIGAIETGWNMDFQVAKFAEDGATLKKHPKKELHKHDGEQNDSISSSTENKKDRVHRDEELKKLKQHVTDEDIDAYLPRRLSSTGKSIEKGTVKKEISRNDFSDGRPSSEAEQDNFSKDILRFARKGLEKRHDMKISVPK